MHCHRRRAEYLFDGAGPGTAKPCRFGRGVAKLIESMSYKLRDHAFRGLPQHAFVQPVSKSHGVWRPEYKLNQPVIQERNACVDAESHGVSVLIAKECGETGRHECLAGYGRKIA